MIGIDTVRISRIARAIEGTGFKNRVFTASEREYCDKKPDAATHYAGIFCAKEAAVKALKCGFGDGVKPTDRDIEHRESGAPMLVAHGKVFVLMSGYNVDVSISHDGDVAVAAVELVKAR